MEELEIGIVEEVHSSKGTGIVRLRPRNIRSLFYLRDGKEIIRQPSRLWFGKKRLDCNLKVGTEIICDRPGRGAVDQWTLLSLYQQRLLSEEAASLQRHTSFALQMQDTFIEDCVLRRVRAKHPNKKFPRVIRRVDMEEFASAVNGLSYASFLRGERESNESRDEMLEQAAIQCFENKPDGIVRGW